MALGFADTRPNGFLGSGWSFPPEFRNNGGEVAMVAGEDDIVQSLRIILSTQLRERTMLPDFGCNLNGYLFEELDQSLVSGLKRVVGDAILNHEPRIDLDEVSVTDSPDGPGMVLIAVRYTVRGTNNRYNMVFPYYLNEASQPVT